MLIQQMETVMSRKHPQNGPSLSAATYKKKAPLTDKELAKRQAREKRAKDEAVARVGEAQQKIASGKRFASAIKANGDVIPVRGAGAKEFWAKLNDDG
jgi:hypothetical protein